MNSAGTLPFHNAVIPSFLTIEVSVLMIPLVLIGSACNCSLILIISIGAMTNLDTKPETEPAIRDTEAGTSAPCFKFFEPVTSAMVEILM